MGILEDDALRRQQIRAKQNALLSANQAQLDYDNRMAAANDAVANAQAKKKGALESVLAGIANGVKNVGDSLYNMGGTGIASIRDIVTGNIGTGKYQKEWKEYAKDAIYKDGDLSDKDYYAKTGGKALDAAATVSDFIPGVGGAAKVALNVGQGVASGIANNYIENGANVSLEDNLKGALIGGASSAAGQAAGVGLGKVAGKGALSKAATSQIGRGAIAGATSGAVGGGLATALNGGSAMDTLSGALQGAGGGAVGGATTAGVMGIAGKIGQGINNKILGVDSQPTTKVAQAPLDTDEAQTEKSNMLGRALKKTGNQLESAQTDITRAERRKYGINDAGQTVENVRKRTGLSSLQDQADFAKNLTGAGDESVMDTIQKYNMAKGKDGKPITLTTDKYEVAINDAVGNNWKKSVMGEDYNDFRDALIADIKNEDPITASNWLKSEAATQRGIADAKGPTADKAARKARIYTDIANKIDDLSYSAIPQKNVNRMFDDTIDEFKTRAQEAKAQGNKKYAKAYENLAKDLENTERTIANYRTFKKDFVKSAQLAEISTGAQSGSLQAGIGKGTNIKNRVLNTLLGEPTNRALAAAGGKLNDLGDAINTGNTGKLLSGASGLVSGINDTVNNTALANKAFGGSDLNMPTVGDVITNQTIRQAGLSQARNVEADQEAEKAQQEMQNAQTDYNNAMAQAQQAYNAAMQQTQINSQAQQQLNWIEGAMQQAMAIGDIQTYAKLLDLYQQASKVYGVGENQTAQASEIKLTDNQTKAYNALQQLNTLEQMSPDLGTALANSPLGGLVNLTGGNDYANQAQSLALTLGYLQSGANVSAKEAENIGKSYIPTAFDSEQTRRNKLARARDLINGYLINTPYSQQ